MSYGYDYFDASVDSVTTRQVKRAPVGTNPLELLPTERTALGKITLQFVGNLDEINRKLEATTDVAAKKKIVAEKIDGLLNSRFEAKHQVHAAYAAIVGIEAVTSGQINAIVQTALLGLRELSQVQGVSPFLF